MARKPQIKDISAQGLAIPGQPNDKLKSAALFKVLPNGEVDSTNSIAPFLLNPSSIQENKSGNWVANNIPGQSDPVMQWVSGGPRTVTFTALVTKDTSHFPFAQNTLLSAIADAAVTAVGTIASQFAGTNIPPLGSIIDSLTPTQGSVTGEELSIAAYLDYYRSLMYPIDNQEQELVGSPPLLVLVMGKALRGGKPPTTGAITNKMDTWVCTNTNIKITKFLPNLAPMEAEVTFQLTQYIITSRGGSLFNSGDIPQDVTAGQNGILGSFGAQF